MSDNVRFHSKWHGKNHHTNSTPGYYDSGVDCIASEADPFMGNFHLSGAHHLYQYVYSGGAWSLQEGIISAGTWLGVESLYHTAVAASAGWGGADSVYTTINAVSSVWQPVGGDVGDYDSTSSGELFTLNSVCVGGTDPNIYSGENWKFKVVGDTVIVGSLSATGGTTYLDTTVSQVSAIHAVANTASGGAPALKVTQNGAANIVNMFRNGNVEVFTILENGDVGIGTPSPQHALHIARLNDSSCIAMQRSDDTIASGNKLGEIFFRGSDADGTTDIHTGASIKSEATETWTSANFGTNLIFNVSDNTSSTKFEAMRIDQSGQVGIGTSSPACAVEISSATPRVAIAHNTTNLADTVVAAELLLGTAGNTFNGTQTADASIKAISEATQSGSNHATGLALFTKPSSLGPGSAALPRVRIDSSGKVGIGTDSPTEKLHLYDGDMLISSGRGIRNTGAAERMTLHNTDGIIFHSASTERVRITAAGNVGIGTSSPNLLLSLEKADTETNVLASGSGPQIKLKNTSDTDGNFASTDYFNSSGYITGRIGAEFEDAGDRNTDLFFATRANSGSLAEHMRIDSTGYVGIGSTSPNAKLQVKGTAASSTSHFNVEDNAHNLLRIWQTSGDQKEVVFNEDSTDLDFRIESDASTHAFFLEGSSGNVGIGTGAAVPEVKLEVDHDAAVTSFTGDQNQGIRITMVGGSNDEYCLLGFGGTQDKDIARIGCKQTSSGSLLQFGTSNNYANSVTNTAMTITAAGLVGINTDGPSYQLSVNGTGYFAGELRCAADIVAFYSSDSRLKENITRIDNALDKVTKLNGYTFTWNDKIVRPADFHNEVEVGVIAQEVQEVLPEIVRERATGYLAIKYEQLTPLLIEAIKELKESNDKLQSRIEELERK